MSKAPAIALALLLLATAPAQAVEFGGWYARATLDGWYDDNLARHEAPSPDLYPLGNRDGGAELGLALGGVLVLQPALELWLTGSARYARPWLYPAWSGGSAGLTGDLDWRIDEATNAYASLGASGLSTGGSFEQAELGLEHRAWPGAWAHVAAGWGYEASDLAAARYALPSASLGLVQGWPTGTRADLSYGYQQRQYDDGRIAPEHAIFLLVAQRLGANWELRGRYAWSIDTSPAAGFHEGFGTLGLAFAL